MPQWPVHFHYHTGLTGPILPGISVRLHGSWDGAGHYSDDWIVTDMQRVVADDGCLAFTATVQLDSTAQGEQFRWSVTLVHPDGRETSAIPTEVKDRNSRAQERAFVFAGPDQQERYYLTHCRWLGANKAKRADGSTGIRFAVWAPNARAVDVVMGAVWDRKDLAHADR